MSWTKTRFCACNMCRFHSVTEPGWEKCPKLGEKNAVGRWLWVKNMFSSLDLENQDKAYLKQQAKRTAYEDADEPD